MKSDLSKNETREYELLDTLTEEFNSFVTIIPLHLRETFKEKISKSGKGFRHFYTSEKVKRFEKLINPRQNKKTEKEQNAKNEPKKRRKFLKRSKYKRLKRKQLKKSVSIV